MRRFAILASGLLLVLAMAGPPVTSAAIHEIIGAACRAGGEEVVPPGQVKEGMSLVRALQSTGVIASIDFAPGLVTVTFDPDRPASKYVSAGFDLLIPDGFGPDVDLLLSPLLVPDAEFAAHANCHNLR